MRSGAALPLAPGSSAASIGASLPRQPAAQVQIRRLPVAAAANGGAGPINGQTNKRTGEGAALD
ncbi:hypothetical protein [Thermogemmatispora aurantia]|uniref:hypothetical protein n=1 Tax=Thermogemmatispora aurantia TaxID=2045279 RepID=UPI00124F3825|nr:hypothetical protein [Thermogemmatispora aurantia]